MHKSGGTSLRVAKWCHEYTGLRVFLTTNFFQRKVKK